MTNNLKEKKDYILSKRVDLIGTSLTPTESDLNIIIKTIDEIISILTNDPQTGTLIELRQYYLYRGNAKIILKQWESALSDYSDARSLISINEQDLEFHYLKSLVTETSISN